jgi:hypothetical protein
VLLDTRLLLGGCGCQVRGNAADRQAYPGTSGLFARCAGAAQLQHEVEKGTPVAVLGLPGVPGWCGVVFYRALLPQVHLSFSKCTPRACM